MGRRRQNNKGSWSELILFVLVILCVYFIMALFDSVLTGDSGREWGKYLRDNWGGAVIVLLLFWMYLCVAKLMKFRIPRFPRQILGTVQLYISFAFMLGLLRETGWSSDWTLSLPGKFGQGLAHFFVLNIGTFITLLLVIGSFILSAYFYGSRIFALSLPSLSDLKFRRQPKPQRTRRRRGNNGVYTTQRPEEILFTRSIPTPTLKPAPYDDYDEYDAEGVQISSSEMMLSAFGKTTDSLPPPVLKPAPEDTQEEQPSPVEQKAETSAIDIIDNALAMIDAAVPDAPKKTKTEGQVRARKIRRPLPDLTHTSEEQETQNEEQDTKNHDEPVFPPPLDLFGKKAKPEEDKDTQKMRDKQGKAIILTLKNFGISASIAGTSSGSSVIQYQIELAPGTKVSRISGLDEELAMALAVTSVRIEAPILGTHYVGIEVPASDRKIIPLRNIFESEEFAQSPARLPLPLGMQIDGRILVQGLEELPHILIAGENGSGKSMFVNSCILSMCSVRRPEELRLILIDPGHVEFAVYDGLPHLLSAPVNDAEGALKALEWAYKEMEERTSNFARSKVRNLAAYNRKLPKEKRLPEIVIVIEELAELIYSEDIEGLIVRLAQKAGASGIYMMLSTQRPSPDVVTTLVKSNIPARAAFTLSSQTDSKNMINISDASKLTGKGDMLFRNTNTPQPVRLQTAYIDEERIADFVDYMSNNLDASELVKF